MGVEGWRGSCCVCGVVDQVDAEGGRAVGGDQPP